MGMDYKAVTICLWLCSAAFITAHSGSNELDLRCEGAQAIYEPPAGANGFIYDQITETTGPSICQQQLTCCSLQAEKDLLITTVLAMRERVMEIWDRERSTCNSAVFKDALVTYIDESRQSLVSLLIDTYGPFFTRHELFDEFYNYLRETVSTGNSCEIGLKFNKLYFEIFLAVLEGDPSVDTSVYPDTREFKLCMYEYYLERSSEEIHTRFVALTRSFNRTLYYIRALNAAEELLNRVYELEFTPQCKQALAKLTFCAQCGGHSARPCAELCLNTLRGCLIDYADLYEPFRRFTLSAIRMKNYLNSNVNPFTHLEQLRTKVFNVIHDTSSDSHNINRNILLRCVQDDRFRRKTSGESQDSSPLLPRSLFPRSTVPPPSDAFNSSAYCLLNIVPLFNSVPDSVCHAVSDSSDEYQCWNGKTIGSYERNLLDFNRTAQQDNPELIVCPALPKRLRDQVEYLKRVTQEMNIISRSEMCPEDDEDCAVDEQRCDFNERRPGFMNTMHQERRSLDEEGAYVSGSGSGCGSGSGSGDGLESGDCKQPEEELEECLIDPMVPITTTTVPTVSSTPSTSTAVTIPTATTTAVPPPPTYITSTVEVPTPTSTSTSAPIPTATSTTTSTTSTTSTTTSTTSTTTTTPTATPPTKEPTIIIDTPAAAIVSLPSTTAVLLSLLSWTVLHRVL